MQFKEISNDELSIAHLPAKGADYWQICEFALSFNGSKYPGDFDASAEIANARRHNSLTDLRTCLFFEQRRYRHFEMDPEGDDLEYIHGLVNKISDIVMSLIKPQPIENCYWVSHGRLLAGEYPRTKDRGSSLARMAALREAGVKAFIDLTNENDNLLSYEEFLDGAVYQRFPIPDLSVPRSPLRTMAILDAIDHHIQQGRLVYVHCWGGVGRTGTIIGCWLSRNTSYTENNVLGKLHDLWRQCPKSRSRKSPETEEQEMYVRNWDESYCWRKRDLKYLDQAGLLSRAQGCLLGQLAGDALGSLVEFKSPKEIKTKFPEGVRLLADGGTFNTIAGQPTDDSEMALALARVLAEDRSFRIDNIRQAYCDWLISNPFDCGGTVAAGLRGSPNASSQANGAMMRISSLGIWGAKYEPISVAVWAKQDAMLTHPHPICLQANALYTMAITQAIWTGCRAEDLYEDIVTWAKEMCVEPSLMQAIENAKKKPPSDYTKQMGWVLIAFQNALWQLLHARNFEEGVVESVMKGGDTDTNAAICGALLGAVYGKDAIPSQWVNALLSCRPEAGLPGVKKPRPECYWPVDALELAERLLDRGR
jgi:ADP-ribosyl-[dinitrogen reductase] hydrolase